MKRVTRTKLGLFYKSESVGGICSCKFHVQEALFGADTGDARPGENSYPRCSPNFRFV